MFPEILYKQHIIITIITNMATKRSCLVISDKQNEAESNIHINYIQKSFT